jgi:hypothetical protein
MTLVIPSGKTLAASPTIRVYTDDVPAAGRVYSSGGTFYLQAPNEYHGTLNYLHPGYTYKYRYWVRYTDGTRSQWSGWQTFNAPGTPNGIPARAPEQASSARAVITGPGSLFVNWVDNAWDEDGYIIERQQSGSQNWTVLATVGPDVTTKRFNNLTGLNTDNAIRIIAKHNNPGGAVIKAQPAQAQVKVVPVKITIDSTVRDGISEIDVPKNGEDAVRIKQILVNVRDANDNIIPNSRVILNNPHGVLNISDHNFNPDGVHTFNIDARNATVGQEYVISFKSKDNPNVRKNLKINVT